MSQNNKYHAGDSRLSSESFAVVHPSPIGTPLDLKTAWNGDFDPVVKVPRIEEEKNTF